MAFRAEADQARSYQDSPSILAAQNTNTCASSEASPLRVGDDFETMVRKMRPFETAKSGTDVASSSTTADQSQLVESTNTEHSCMNDVQVASASVAQVIRDCEDQKASSDVSEANIACRSESIMANITIVASSSLDDVAEGGGGPGNDVSAAPEHPCVAAEPGSAGASASPAEEECSDSVEHEVAGGSALQPGHSSGSAKDGDSIS